MKPCVFLSALILFAFILFPTMCPAVTATDEIKFQNLTIEDGLSQSSVFAIQQDKRGLMWFGTWDGLNRYDGYRFTIYKYNEKNPYSLSNNEIRALYEDRKGELWIGTMGGLNWFDREKERFTRFQHDPDNPNSLAGNRVHAIAEGRDSSLWIGTQDGGLSRLDRLTQRFQNYLHNPDDPNSLNHNDIRTICVDTSGILWIGTWGGGLNRFDPAAKQFSRYKHDPDDPTSLSHNNVRTVFEDRRGVIWIGTEDGGLSRFNRKSRKFKNFRPDKNDPFSLSDKEVISIYESRTGELWIGTRGGGLNKFDRKNQQFIRYKPIRGNNICSLYEDVSGILWIGTYEGGVSKYLPRHKNFIHYQHQPDDPTSLSGNDVRSIYKDKKGELWVGVWDHGLNRMDPNTGKFTRYIPDPENSHSLSQHDVIAIFEDHQGVMWIGTAKGGLNKFDRPTNRFTHYKNNPDDAQSLFHNFVFCIYEDRNHTLWIGGYLGRSLSRFDRKTETFINYIHDPNNPDSIAYHKVRKLFEDSNNNFWLTTGGGGLCLFDRKTEKFKYYTHDPKNPQTISGNNPTVIFEDNRGWLWVGIWGGGLNKFDRKTETFSRYREADGLPSDSVMGILEDEKGNLWLSTFRGLSRFNPEKETFTNYTPNDGLQSWEFNSTVAFKSEDGQMFFGGVNGFNAFYPDQIKDNPYTPTVVLTDFKIFNRSLPIGDESILQKSIMELNEITLSFKESVFSIEFAALNYIFPEKNRYAYKMEGFDKDWRYVGSDHRIATYTNLDPGTYKFRIKATNNDGMWNEKETDLSIIITPPWWKAIGFITVTVFLVIAGLFLGYRWRINALELKRQKLAKEVDSRTRELKESNQQLEKLHQDLEKRIEQRTADLKESEHKYRSVVENANEVIIVSQDNAVKYFNPQAIKWSGYSPDDFSNTPFIEFIHAEDRDRVMKEFKERISGKKLYSRYTVRSLTKDGDVKWVIVNSVQIQWEGRPASLTMFTDITEQKAAASKLQESYNRFQTIANFAYDWETLETTEERLQYVSPSCERISGYRPQEFIDNPELMRKIILPADRDKWDEHRQNVITLSDSQEIQFRIRKKDGEVRWIEHACRPVQGAEGESLGIRASNRDVTRGKLTEETLKKKDRMLEEAQTIARLGSWDWNILNNELAWSDEVYRIFGFEPHEFGATYEAFLERIHSDDRENVKDAVNQALNDPSSKYNIAHRIIKLDGSERIVRERGNVIFNDNGKPSRMVGTVQDITDIRIMEAETHKLRMEISHMDRVGMMGTLGAGLGHELNQPLAAILSNAQAALRFLDNDQPDINEVKEALQDIVLDDKRAGEIVHTIRNIMGKSDLEQEKIHLNETIREVIKLIKSEVIERNVSLSENFQTDMPKFLGNRIQIQQVILNLLMNALDAIADNDEASRKVIISTSFKENDGIILNVSDSGPGIKTDQVEDVFDSFHTTKASGLGIGLSICRSIAEKHGGTIWAENLPEGGAAFFFKLPSGGVKDE